MEKHHSYFLLALYMFALDRHYSLLSVIKAVQHMFCAVDLRAACSSLSVLCNYSRRGHSSPQTSPFLARISVGVLSSFTSMWWTKPEALLYSTIESRTMRRGPHSSLLVFQFYSSGISVNVSIVLIYLLLGSFRPWPWQWVFDMSSQKNPKLLSSVYSQLLGDFWLLMEECY